MNTRDALERREAGRWSVYQWYDESVLELEELSGWRTSTNGGHYVPTWAREKRQIAWNRYCRSQVQRRQHEKIAERDALSKLALDRLLEAVRSAPAVKDMNWWEAFDRSRSAVEERPPPQLEQKALDPDRGPPTSRALADRWARFMHDGECRGEVRHQVQKEIVPTGQLNGGVR